jgi:acetyltransferase
MSEPRHATSDIARFFDAQSVALVGASREPGSLGTVVLDNLRRAGFGGPIYPVNPRHADKRREKWYRSLRDIGAPVDLAVIVTPAAVVPQIFEDCAACGIGTAVVLSAGFREAGPDGKAREQAVLDAARRHGIRFMGPNCLGIMRPKTGLNATFSHRMARAGRIALVSQSGALCTAMLDWADAHALGFSAVVSSGIAADVDFGEVLDYLVVDAATEAIMLYIEGVHDARRFMSALRAASRAKPVIVMKAGRHAEGRRAAVSHTGAMVGTDAVFDAALRRAGVVRVREYTDFFAVAQTLDLGTRSAGPRLAIVTNGGGPGVIAADYSADKGLSLAELSPATHERLDALLPASWSGRNPVDVLGDADAARYTGAVEACLDDPAIDAVLAIWVPQAVSPAEPVAASIAELARRSSKALLTCWMGEATMSASRALFRERGIASYQTPEAAVEAFAAVAAHHANQQLLLQVPESLGPRSQPDIGGARIVIESALAEGRNSLDPLESKAVLAAFGVPVVQSLPAHDAAEAVAVAREIGFPVAMKIHSPDITHKSDVAGVRLNVGSADEVRVAYRSLLAAVRERRSSARLEGVLLEPMLNTGSGRELMLGVAKDPVFGPVISVGLGGTLVEIVRDRALALPPLNRYLSRRMIDDTRSAKYLAAFRGLPPARRDLLEDVILRLSEVACELPWIAELDINPFVVSADGAWAVDARIVLQAVNAAAREYAHMAIHPYPSRLVGTHRLADGTPVTIRPIRPEDGELEREFVNGLSQRSKYLRFMYALKEITPQMLSRFTQIDYDREMALIALVDAGGGEREIAVARYVTYPDGRSCEFAIVVADRWQNRGIATELLRRLIDIARERRLERMDGTVLAENRGMLALAAELGFEQHTASDDPQLVLMTLEL